MLEILKDFGKSQITPKQVARVLGVYACTVHAYVYTHMRPHLRTRTHTHAHMHTYTHTHTHTHTRTHICMEVHMCC